MSLIYLTWFVFLEFVKSVDAKECNFYDGTRLLSFRCSIYEYCCGTRCCRSPTITFYQMWYFWLMVFLTILFCSGGGWWYRLRNHDAFMTPSMYSRATQNRPVYNAVQGPTIYTSSVPMASAANIAQYPPPPPYYGPPPSYDAVVNQSQPPQPPVTQPTPAAPRQN